MCGRARCTLQRERVAQEAGVPCEQFANSDKCMAYTLLTVYNVAVYV